jgi:hypothetical protein
VNGPGVVLAMKLPTVTVGLGARRVRVGADRLRGDEREPDRRDHQRAARPRSPGRSSRSPAVTGNTNANGTFRITKISATTFSVARPETRLHQRRHGAADRNLGVDGGDERDHRPTCASTPLDDYLLSSSPS